ncbi:MAG: hypothetical protein H9897_01535 [Candidatus Ureaplasma intestinipullorum]|uniref:Uncharacterized protein n=1 Tax=Candidatus Ureaplasma intestinipullorum TaxID=2838770 RepID=A0A9E2KXD6_9BACT|nr:hypothetical protein [Candidatus Ureaplasma intestinipullorum]
MNNENRLNYLRDLEYHKFTLKLFGDFLKESVIFIVFWLLNGLMPIFICLISASIKQYGAYYVLGIGYITAFQLGYVQIGWVISIAILFVIKKIYASSKFNEANYSTLYFNAFITIVIVAISLVPLFFVPSYVYNLFANNHVNTIISQKVAENYIFGLLPYIFINVIMSFIIMNIHTKQGLKISLPLLIGSNFLIISFCALLSLLPNYSSVELTALMIGFSISIGSFISLIIIVAVSFFCGNIKDIFQRIHFPTFWMLFKSIFKQTVSILSIQIIKGIALIVLGNAISATMTMTSPMGYQLSRVVWYNYLYLIPFFAYGLGDAMMFYGMRKNIITTNKHININIWFLFIFAFIIEILIAIGLYFSIEPLSAFYVQYKEIDWNYINLNDVDLVYTINYLYDAGKIKLTPEALNSVLNLIKWCNNNPNNQLAVKLLHGMRVAIVEILSNNNMTGAGVSEYLLLNNKSYIYISLYAVGYSTALLINNTNLSSKHRYSNAFETCFLILMQIIVISSVVAMGVKLQSTSSTFPFLDAWSFPLAIAGIGSLFLYIVLYFTHLRKMKFKYDNSLISINDWNEETKERIVII